MVFELTLLNGVGQASVQKFKKLGITTVLDLLFHLPLRYQDKTKITDMGDLYPNQFSQIQGHVVKAYIINSRTPILVCEISDGENVIPLKFFNFFYSQRVKMKPNSIIRAYGEVRLGQYGLEMLHPEYQHLKNKDEAMTECLTAIYPKTEGLSQKLIQKAIKQAIELMLKGELDLEELLPANYLEQHQLPTLLEALQYVHLPPPDADVGLLVEGIHNTQHRLILEEILAHLLTLHKVRTQVQSHMATPLGLSENRNEKFLSQLAFRLTTAQTRVVSEIQRDLRQSNPMQRLLQGDVGSGKTVVAAMAMLAATANGYQAVMMAPTEILAEQHRSTLAEYFTEQHMAYLSGAIKGTARVAVLEHIASTAKIIIGTHALFQTDVVFNKLALIVIDEQHRFGVHQRLALKNKGQTDSRGNYIYPHTLIMTATPIPRTLAQTAYANLDLSIIDELPPNRKVINTVLLSNDKMPQLAERIRQACGRGEQAYWVCTLIDESEVLRAKAATDTVIELQQMFPDLNIALIHGRLKSDEKKAIMQQYKNSKIQILVATTVIEVGVDVPNASLMVIENAERLGLSQLHQLRGRVGRGNRQSHCVLMYQYPLTENAQIRLQTMRKTNDGFEIAKQDLKLRGPGEILGTRQKGSMEFRLANMERDKQWFEEAKSLAKLMTSKYPENCEKIIDRWNRDEQELAKI